ncbi:MAG: SDR family oxidoreductase [Microthrixaceae bacterium]
MKVLVTGGAGLVGSHLVASAPPGADVAVTWRTTPPPDGAVGHRVELSDRTATARLLDQVRPDVVVHTAYSRTLERDVVQATTHVAATCRDVGAALVHLSTDVVFGGDRAPYVESDPVAPINDYGRAKVAAERVVRDAVPDACITRTSLVVATAPPDRATQRLFDDVAAGERPTLFTDEVRCPIRAVDLAAVLWALLELPRDERRGVWHLPGPEALTRMQIGTRLLVGAGLDPERVRPGSARDMAEPRPADLTLRTARAAPGPRPRPFDTPDA